MNRLVLLLFLATLPLAAQGRLFEEDASLPPSLGVQVQAGIPRGAADRDLNWHYGWGLGVSYPWHLGGRHLLRPNVEYNQYRLSPPPAPAWATGTDQSLTFHTWKFGIDYVLYQEPWVHRGPYVMVGAGIQYAEVDHLVQNGTQQTLMEHRSALTAPWFGTGVGYQFTPDVALELRYSAADYGAERGEHLASYALTEPIQRDGRFLHFILAVRAPF